MNRAWLRIHYDDSTVTMVTVNENRLSPGDERSNVETPARLELASLGFEANALSF